MATDLEQFMANFVKSSHFSVSSWDIKALCEAKGLLVKTQILMESVPEYTYNCILVNTIIELGIGQQQFGYGFMGALYYLGIEHYLAGIFQFITYTSLSVYIITGLYNGANSSTCFAGQASSNRVICKRQNSRMNKTLPACAACRVLTQIR